MSAFTQLRETEFSATEKRIADYILKNSRELPDITISTVAKECETSKSMVVQLCKTAGFKGYKDLCSQLLVERTLLDMQQSSEGEYEDIHPNCSVSEICQMIIREEIRSIHDTGELLDFQAVETAVDMLVNADRIHLFGVGGSEIAALDLFNKLSRIGLNVRFSTDVHCQLLETSCMTEQSVAIVFSHNGRTKDMIEACELVHDMGAKVISVTRYGRSPISDASDLPLYVASTESMRRVTTMGSRLSTLVMVDALFACLAGRLSDRVEPIAVRNSQIAAKRRK